MWIPSFLRRRPTPRPNIVLNSRGLRNQKKANKLRAINNEIKSILYERLKNMGRPHVSEITMQKLIEEIKQYKSNYGIKNFKSMARSIRIPKVANIGNNNFRAANWPYAYTSMYNPEVTRYRKHPTKDYIIVYNESTRSWRRATNNENTKIRNRKPTYGNQRSF